MQIDFPLEIGIFDNVEALSASLYWRLKGVSGTVLLITGLSTSAAYADQLFGYAPQLLLHRLTLSNNSVLGVYATERELRRISPRLLIAVGGGKVSDFCKRLAYIANIPLILIPTIIANDGLISPVAVLQDDEGSVSLPGRMPDTVLIDMQIIAKAPVRYLRSAACDLITNLSATNDWERETGGETGRIHHLALQLSRMAAHQILDCRDWHHDSPVFLRTIVYGQMLSGIAMALSGSSRPCSGSEHLIAHALDAKGLGMEMLHGEKVGIASRFCLHLQNVVEARLETFFDSFGVSRVLPGCENMDRNQMNEIFALARTMRPGRTTILDTFTDQTLSECYAAYIGIEKDDNS